MFRFTLKQILVALAFISLSTVAFAQSSGNCGDGVNWAITGVAPNQTLTINYDGIGTGEMTDYDNIYNRPPWFTQRADIKTLTIDNGVTTIGNNAFDSLDQLVGTLMLPTSLISIGNIAFWGCTNLTGNLTIPDEVTTIGSQAFDGCSGINGTLTIPASVNTIGTLAFRNCSNITAVTNNALMPQTIDANVFQGVNIANLTLTVPCMDLYSLMPIWNDFNSITGTNEGNCPPISSISIAWDISKMPGTDNVWATFYPGIQTLIISGLGEMKDYINTFDYPPYYDYRNNITTLIIEDGITHIGDFSFYEYNLTGSVIIPNSVFTIGLWAFVNCNGLTDLIIGNSVTSIGGSAFSGCTGLHRIISLAKTPPSIVAGWVFNYMSQSTPIYVPCVSVSNYQSVWTYFNNISCSNYKLTVLSNDNSLGFAGIDGDALVVYYGTLFAAPKTNGIFTGWSDGNIDNPRTITFTNDSTFTALFVPNNTTALEAEIINLQNDLSDCNNANAVLQNNLSDCNSANVGLQNDLDDCNTANVNLQNDLDDCNSANVNLQNDLDDCNSANVNLQNDLDDCNSANADLQNDLDDCNSANADLQNDLDDCNSANAGLQNDLDDCNTANVNLQNDLDDCNSANVGLQNDLDDCNSANVDLQNGLDDCNSANVNLQNDLDDCNSANDTLHEQITTLTDELSDCNNENEILQGNLEECETERDNLQQLLDDCLSGIGSDNLQSGLIIYPNPIRSDGVLNITGEILHTGDKIEIFDMSGRLLSVSFAQGTETSIHIGVLPQGTYLLRLAGQRGVKFEVR